MVFREFFDDYPIHVKSRNLCLSSMVDDRQPIDGWRKLSEGSKPDASHIAESANQGIYGSDGSLVASPVFKTGGPRTAGGGFDSHPLPPDFRPRALGTVASWQTGGVMPYPVADMPQSRGGLTKARPNQGPA